MRNLNFFLTSILLTTLYSCSDRNQSKEQNETKKIPNSILIVYMSGNPSKTIADIKPEEVDTYSGATPSDMNIEIISQKLYTKLKSKNYNVKMLRASEISSYKEIVQYDMLIIGTPTYFWNMHWEIKKMMDIHFEKIYIAKRDEFKSMKHIVFSMAEYGGCGESANNQMKSAITDCSAKLDTSMVFIVKQTMPQYDEQIAQLAALAENEMEIRD